MQHIHVHELIRAKAALAQAETLIALVTAIFRGGGYASGARRLNASLQGLHDEIALIEREIQRRS